MPFTGAFVAPDGKALPVAESLPNAHMRLFGGAQYHRAMAEFRTCVGELVCPDIRCVLRSRHLERLHFTCWITAASLRKSMLAVSSSTTRECFLSLLQVISSGTLILRTLWRECSERGESRCGGNQGTTYSW